MGADVVTLMRGEQKQGLRGAIMMRGRRQIALRSERQGLRRAGAGLLEGADALIEGYRPGVMERLGFGPDVVLARNKRIVYARMTGWGQSGPLANAAGHDINYISVTGALAAIGPKDRPVPPLNLVGDYRRRRAVSRGRHSGGAAGGAKIRPGPGGRCRDVRRRGVADVAVLRTHRDRALEGRPRIAICSTAARISTAPINARTASSSRWARSSRNSMPNCAGSPASTTRSMTARWMRKTGRR